MGMDTPTHKHADASRAQTQTFYTTTTTTKSNIEIQMYSKKICYELKCKKLAEIRRYKNTHTYAVCKHIDKFWDKNKIYVVSLCSVVFLLFLESANRIFFTLYFFYSLSLFTAVLKNYVKFFLLVEQQQEENATYCLNVVRNGGKHEH